MNTPTPKSSLPVIQLDKEAYAEAEACVHCGLCLPACPTYSENQNEADSPRGRIYLMKGLADGKIAPSFSVKEHLELCLDCRACETACPSGVTYHKIIHQTREQLDHIEIPPPQPDEDIQVSSAPSGFTRSLINFTFYSLFTSPLRLRFALLPARITHKLGLWKLTEVIGDAILPIQLQKMRDMAPKSGPLWPKRLKQVYPAKGEKRMTVGFLDGCIGSVIYSETHMKGIELLTEFGCEVHVPHAQSCCGAIHHHGGHTEEAKAMALKNLKAYEDCDVVVADIAGCGAMLKEYKDLFKDDPEHLEAATAFSAKARDISELLVSLDPPKPKHRIEKTVTYHDACHLAHGQQIRNEPRQLLSMIDGLKIISLPEYELCCGAAGTYNLEKPEMARRLGQRKVQHIHETGADCCATGNVGCSMQIRSEADRMDKDFEMAHPVELFHAAYFGTK